MCVKESDLIRMLDESRSKIAKLKEGIGKIAAMSRLGYTECPLPSEMREINRFANHLLNS